MRTAAPARVVPPRKLRLEMRLTGMAKGLSISYADLRSVSSLTSAMSQFALVKSAKRPFCYAVTMPSGSRPIHLPRVKSGKSMVLLLAAMECSLNSDTAHSAAPS